MIPDFDENGNLPPGTYDASLSEVVKRFRSGSPKRRYLTKQLQEFVAQFGDLFVGLYIDGSYVTRKLTPGDVDLLVLLPPGVDCNSPRIRELLIFAEKERKKRPQNKHALDIFPFEQGQGVRYMSNILTNWQRDRNRSFAKKGIIYVEMKA